MVVAAGIQDARNLIEMRPYLVQRGGGVRQRLRIDVRAAPRARAGLPSAQARR